MKRKLVLLLAVVLCGGGGSLGAQDLPKEVLVDQSLNQAAEFIRLAEEYQRRKERFSFGSGNYDGGKYVEYAELEKEWLKQARASFNRVESLTLNDHPPEFLFLYGKFLLEKADTLWGNKDDWFKGRLLIKQFLFSSKRTSENYGHALGLLRESDKNLIQNLGWSSLHIAAWEGDLKASKTLISAGANVDVKDNAGFTPLHRAIQSGQIGTVQILIAGGADVNAKNAYGVTPLIRSVDGDGKGKIEIVKVLLNAGAEVNERNVHNETPLYIAAANQSGGKAVKILIGAGAEVNVKEKYMDTPLHIAASKGYFENVKALLDAGANVHAKNKFDKTPLQSAFGSTDECDVKTVKALIAAGADVNAKRKTGFRDFIPTVLYDAVTTCEEAEVIKILINAGADVHVESGFQETVLFGAAGKGNVAIIRTLIRAGLDVNEKSEHGLTPLYNAANGGHFEAVKTLIDAGADVNANVKMDETIKTPLQAAVESGEIDTVTEKREDGKTWHIVGDRNDWDKTELVKALIDAGANVDVRDEHGNTLLHEIVFYPFDSECAKILIDAGVDVNIKNNSGRTALHSAASHGHPKQVSMLINAGAEVNARDNDGKTPLQIAEREESSRSPVSEHKNKSYWRVVSLLKSAGARE